MLTVALVALAQGYSQALAAAAVVEQLLYLLQEI